MSETYKGYNSDDGGDEEIDAVIGAISPHLVQFRESMYAHPFFRRYFNRQLLGLDVRNATIATSYLEPETVPAKDGLCVRGVVLTCLVRTSSAINGQVLPSVYMCTPTHLFYTRQDDYAPVVFPSGDSRMHPIATLLDGYLLDVLTDDRPAALEEAIAKTRDVWFGAISAYHASIAAERQIVQRLMVDSSSLFDGQELLPYAPRPNALN